MLSYKVTKGKDAKKIRRIHVNSVDIKLLIWLVASQHHFQQDNDPMLLQKKTERKKHCIVNDE